MVVPKDRGDDKPFLTCRCPLAHPCFPMGTAPVHTLGRQKVHKHSHGGDEDAGHDDVDDVEEWLALDDEVEDNLLVLGVIGSEVLRIDDLPSGAVLDGPFAVLCDTAVPCESHHPTGGTGAASPPAWGRRKGKAGDWCGCHRAPKLGMVWGKVLEPLGRERSTTEHARVPG